MPHIFTDLDDYIPGAVGGMDEGDEAIPPPLAVIVERHLDAHREAERRRIVRALTDREGQVLGGRVLTDLARADRRPGPCGSACFRPPSAEEIAALRARLRQVLDHPA